jgi:hypothetical protein
MTRPLAAPGTDLLDDKVRARLAEIRAAAGVPHAQVSMEVLYFLPRGFLEAYATIFSLALKSDAGGDATARAQQEAGALGKARGRGAKTNGKRYKRSFVVLNEQALDLKEAMDKRLRNIGRDAMQALSGGDFKAGAAETRCASCGMFLQAGWKFCPKDGDEVGLMTG